MSEHFTIDELTFSQTAVRQNIDNTPSPEVLANLNVLMGVLEQVRSLTGPLTVSSGYRCPALNAAVGGAKDSAHVLGFAADITSNKMSPRALAMLIRDSDVIFDQVIFEGTWVHIGLSMAPRLEVLTAVFKNGRATYVRGIS